jgi:hypothetical protein
LSDSRRAELEANNAANYAVIAESAANIEQAQINIDNATANNERQQQNIQENQMYALSRWDLDEDMKAKHHNTWDSQDTWIFKNSIKSGNYDIPLGIPGCDNRIAYELKEAGYEVINPSKTVKTYHYHLSNYRSYREIDRLEGEFYCITPSGIYEN